MARMRHLPASAHRRMPWKNGGGETIEVAVHPKGAGLADFDWRVSMARVGGDGPFSVFEGVERTLCILEGEGLELAVEGLGGHRLTQGSDPFAFPADAPTEACLLGGPIVDLNAMTRRATHRHRVERFVADASAGLLISPRPAAWSLLLAADACRTEGASAPMRLARYDALVAQGSFPTVRVEALGASATLYLITIGS